MDMIKMMEQAMELSKLMNNNAPEDGSDVNGKMPDMLNMMRMLKLFSGIRGDAADRNDERPGMYNGESYYDEEYYDMPQNPAIKTIKAAIPYLEYKYQRSFGIMLKLMEIEEFLTGIRSTAPPSGMGQTDWRRGMLASIKPQVDDSKQYMIDILIRFIDLKEIINMSNSMRGGY